jgi:hypothetical protein
MLINLLFNPVKILPNKHIGIFTETIVKTVIIEREININFEEHAKFYKLKVENLIQKGKNTFALFYLQRIIKELKMVGLKKIINVFVSYSHDITPEWHKSKVESFTNFLRTSGYDAKCDTYLRQQQSAIDFEEMMKDQILSSDKIIIVLSEGFKNKADRSNESGVKSEMRLIHDELQKKPNKIILASFVSFDKIGIRDILPAWLSGREVIDLKVDSKNGYKNLFAKLKEIELLKFEEVNSNQQEIEVSRIEDFTLEDI